ncbi:hypothetical protein CSOJ01_08131 [Colletotrichum sojae]|uniref:Uncharacterized protein n=1 Tax=Colletotrichum sojae TaxID=2175907 RepID=A0A8H6MSI7_9PEZI|nr:hypothetical protein CSOJ01_08131 [Colletotrichum sojae]
MPETHDDGSRKLGSPSGLWDAHEVWETRLTPHADPASTLVRPIREIDAGLTIGIFTRPLVVFWWRYLTLTFAGLPTPYEAAGLVPKQLPAVTYHFAASVPPGWPKLGMTLFPAPWA